MLLESYKLEIFNSECNPGAMTVMCHAHLYGVCSPCG